MSAGPIRSADLAGLADRSQESLVLHVDGDEARRPEPWLDQLQRVLRPGFAARLVHQGGSRRRLRRAADHYFDVEDHGNTLLLRRRSTSAAVSHFESLAPHYWSEIPAHVQQHFLAKKTSLLQEYVRPGPGIQGLDLGCGVGRHAHEVQGRLGGRLVGLDPVRPSLLEARKHAAPVDWIAGDVLRLPLRDESLDYAYTVNVLHHLKRGEQERGVREILRALRPGAILVVHEMNTRNPLFHWYLRKVFPRLRHIDRGDEEFIDPRRWPLVDGFDLLDVRYMGFVPDFAPRWTLRMLRALERWLERGRARKYSIHYAAILRKR